MEFFPGAFESEWERRRAALLHDLDGGRRKSADSEWEWLRRGGGVVRLPADGPGGSGGSPSSQRHELGDWSTPATGSSAIRPMRTRLEAVAKGSQPAVVKLASYGGGGRAASMMSYVSRGGELTVVTETGERIDGRSALAEVRADWEHLFDNRTDSRDIGVFRVSVETSPGGPVDLETDEVLRQFLRDAFGSRHFVYTATFNVSGTARVEGVVVLRDENGERLTGDAKAAAIVQERFEQSRSAGAASATFSFHGYGNGVEYGTARVRDLVEAAQSAVHDEKGRRIETVEEAGVLVQKEWRKDLHSRKGRDVMHLIVSARAGTDAAAFNSAVREFLGAQFDGHRYVFAMHDPADDPKDMGQGGRRPHIHAHAIITMRSETGERIETSPSVFREWRIVMAEKARDHGIDMEMTDRREFASAPAFTRNQVRPVNYQGQTEHVGTSEAAQERYDSKRANVRTIPMSQRSREHSAAARQAWEEVAATSGDREIVSYANRQVERIEGMPKEEPDRRSARFDAAPTSHLKEIENAIGREEDHMRQMTRPEFEAYEKRVDAVLQDVEKTLDAADRQDFVEVATAARDIVNIRREHVGVREQIEAGERQEQQRDKASVGEHDRSNTATDPNKQIVESDLHAEREDRIGKSAEAPEMAGPRSQLSSNSDKAASSEVISERTRDLSIDDREHHDAKVSLRSEREREEIDVVESMTNRKSQQRSSVRERDAERADTPQQKVPRLRELEREIEAKNEQDRER